MSASDDRELTREELRFPQEVEYAFRYLVDDYGFRVVRSEARFVRYESPNAFVHISHGEQSFEFGFEAGQLINGQQVEERPFYLGDFLEMAGVSDPDKARYDYAAVTPHGVKKLLPEFARIVRRFAEHAFEGNPEIFDILRQVRDSWIDRSDRLQQLKVLRRNVAEAWQARNYSKVATLLETMQDDLSPSEAKKLDYCRRKLSSDPRAGV